LIGALAGLRPELAGHAGQPDFGPLAVHFEAAIAALESATRWIAATWNRDPALVAAGAAAYLRLFGTVVGGWLAIRAALAARALLEKSGDARFPPNFLRSKIVCAKFFAEQDLVLAPALARIVTQGGATIAEADESAL
jgi:hypothetical protein